MNSAYAIIYCKHLLLYQTCISLTRTSFTKHNDDRNSANDDYRREQCAKCQRFTCYGAAKKYGYYRIDVSIGSRACRYNVAQQPVKGCKGHERAKDDEIAQR